MIRYPERPTDPATMLRLLEIEDKAVHTAATARSVNISGGRIIVIGDSGGDGPHFQWAGRQGGHLIGSMTKASLTSYCQRYALRIDLYFGPTHAPGDKRDRTKEMQVNFMDLCGPIEAWLRHHRVHGGSPAG